MKHIFELEPLTRESFKRRIVDTFPAVYLTLISIIQGVALGILISNTFKYIENPLFAETWVRFLPYSSISFIMIILISYEYTWFLGVFRWSPLVWDNVVPFVLGFSEIGPMFFLTNTKVWWLLTAIFCFVGAGAFFNTLWHCKQRMFGQNYQAYQRTKTELKGNISIAIIAAFFGVFMWWFSSTKVLYWYLEILFPLPLLALAIFMMWKGEKYTKNLHSDFGLIR